MAFAGLDRRTVLKADQNRVDLMKLEPPEGALHGSPELFDGPAGQSIVRADLPEHQIRPLDRRLVPDPFGRLGGDFPPYAAIADEKSRPLNVLSRMFWS